MKCNNRELKIIKGDLLKAVTDAIVNPANTKLYMGGGVAGLIKRYGGESIEREAIEKGPINIGEAIATGSGMLKCKYIIHAPTVVNPGDRSSKEYVRKAVNAALKLANSMRLKSIAFPSMGTGVGGLEYAESAEVMIDEILRFISSLNEKDSIKEVHIYLISDHPYNEFKNTARNLISKYNCTENYD